MHVCECVSLCVCVSVFKNTKAKGGCYIFLMFPCRSFSPWPGPLCWCPQQTRQQRLNPAISWQRVGKGAWSSWSTHGTTLLTASSGPAARHSQFCASTTSRGTSSLVSSVHINFPSLVWSLFYCVSITGHLLLCGHTVTCFFFSCSWILRQQDCDVGHRRCGRSLQLQSCVRICATAIGKTFSSSMCD